MHRTADAFLQLPRRRLLSALELHAAAIGSVAAIVLLVGWGFNVDLIKSVLPGFPTMRPRTAFAFMMLSLSCMLSLRGSKRAAWLSSAVAAGMVAWVVSLVVRNWGVEVDGESPLVPIQATLLSLILAGVTMLIVNLAPRFGVIAGGIALSVATPALYRIFTLLLFWGAPPQHGSLLSSMAIHTAVLIVWFMSVCILMHPRLGFGEAILQASLRGRLLRRALPFMIFLPVITGALGLSLSLAFHWPDEVLFALAATLSVTLGTGMIWWLSRLVGNWQAEANQHAGHLSRANEALEQYASSAAHDLKAPARHVMLYGELLEEALGRSDIEAARRHARSIRDSVAELPGMIEGMLDYSRSAHAKLNLAATPLSELVQAAGALQVEDLKSAGARVVVLHEALLRCDRQLMTAVFQNLIANGLNSRRKDRQLAIRIDAKRDGAVWEISVEDNGVGFDPDFVSVAFNPLAWGVTRAGQGAGIGLATCRTIVHSHGGEIRVDPTFREGARIEFTLPAPREDDTPGR